MAEAIFQPILPNTWIITTDMFADKTKDLQFVEKITSGNPLFDFYDESLVKEECACGSNLLYKHSTKINDNLSFRTFWCTNTQCIWKRVNPEDWPYHTLNLSFMKFMSDIEHVQIFPLLVSLGLCSSNADARREVQNKRVIINDKLIDDAKFILKLNTSKISIYRVRLGKSKYQQSMMDKKFYGEVQIVISCKGVILVSNKGRTKMSKRCCGNCDESWYDYGTQSLKCSLNYGGWGGDTSARSVRSDSCCDSYKGNVPEEKPENDPWEQW